MALNPSNGLIKQYECDRRQTDRQTEHATEKCVGICKIVCTAKNSSA